MSRFRGNTEHSYIYDSYMCANKKKRTNALLDFYANSGYGTYGSVTLYTGNQGKDTHNHNIKYLLSFHGKKKWLDERASLVCYTYCRLPVLRNMRSSKSEQVIHRCIGDRYIRQVGTR